MKKSSPYWNKEAFSRSSRPEVFRKNGVLRNFAKFTGTHLCQSLFFNKVADLRLWHKCFAVDFAKFLRIPFFTEHLWWLLLFFITIDIRRVVFAFCYCQSTHLHQADMFLLSNNAFLFYIKIWHNTFTYFFDSDALQ